MKEKDGKPKTILQWRQFLERFEEGERWRTGEDDRPMTEAIPDISRYHADMRLVADILRKSVALIPKALDECGNCKPSVPCNSGCLAEAFLGIFGLHGKPKGSSAKNGSKRKGKK